MNSVNLKQLAQELNLSVSTVSRALRDSWEISTPTKQRVFDLAKKMNFQPNPYASSLRKHRSRTIAVVIPEVANNFFALAIKGIETVAREKGYHVLIYITNEDVGEEAAIASSLQSGRVDGVILSLCGSTQDTRHLLELQQRNIPLVFFDRVSEGVVAPKVMTNDHESGFIATEHLIKAGCRRVAHLTISMSLSISNKRQQGYEDALRRYERTPEAGLIVHCGNDEAANYQLIRELLMAENRPTGVFASVEKLAVQVYHVCRELGLRIPEDVKVISFSNLVTASLLNPSLTTIAQPAYDMGKEAATILFRRLEKKYIVVPEDRVMLPARLEVRDSTMA
ncbi:MAG TPA: LacI family DNA-binding transcriptional regulator [Puia sp.]|uniref:LacI family DNA-binding transcriptional regulator n=1 Tax=Puia sp. TaxID=2045100 RepID=UPI002CD81B6C|nr:LacI family DNA-binding transcriptional regulator [Puia sp.]HVU94727.1 LacI family DNA-binding transcriptional regulator [Puia sp.]